MLSAVLMTTCLCSCADDARRITAAGELAAATEASRALPNYPGECRVKHRSGIVAGDRLDTAVQKLDGALVRYERQVDFCAAWYKRLQDGFAEGQQL